MADELTTLQVASRAAHIIQTMKSDSLFEYNASTRLEPIVILDERVVVGDQGSTKDLLQTMLSMFTAQYLTAVNSTMNIGDVKIIRILNQFGTDRSLLTAAGNSRYLGHECIDLSNGVLVWSYDTTPYYGVESLGTESLTLPLMHNPKRISFGNEAVDNLSNIYSGRQSVTDVVDNATIDRANISSPHNSQGMDKTIKVIYDRFDLAVGKIIEVRFSSDGKTVSVPVQCTLIPKVQKSQDFIDAAENNSFDKSMKGRWHQWRSGDISFIKDYLFAFDRIEADKKALLADKSGTLSSVRRTRVSNIVAAVLSGDASPNAVSTMVVIAKQTARELETVLKGRLDSVATRNRYFASNCTMMLVVVDTQMEKFTFYIKGMADAGSYTFEDIKNNSTKAGNNDISGYLQAYKLGNLPNL